MTQICHSASVGSAGRFTCLLGTKYLKMINMMIRTATMIAAVTTIRTMIMMMILHYFLIMQGCILFSRYTFCIKVVCAGKDVVWPNVSDRIMDFIWLDTRFVCGQEFLVSKIFIYETSSFHCFHSCSYCLSGLWWWTHTGSSYCHLIKQCHPGSLWNEELILFHDTSVRLAVRLSTVHVAISSTLFLSQSIYS